MAVTEIPWSDGSGDKIYLTCDALEGNQTVLVSSDANASASSRSQSVTFSTGGISQVLTVSQEPGVLVPVFYDWLVFDAASKIVTDYIIPSQASFSTIVKGETVKSGVQYVFTAGSGENLIRIRYASNTTSSSGRRFQVYYGASSNKSGNQTQTWSNIFYVSLQPTRYGWTQTGAGRTLSAGSGYPTDPLCFGGTEAGTSNFFSGKMSTFYVYGSDAKNAASYNALIAFTPVATFRPCTYGGNAGFWYVEGNKFFGNSADSGSLTASNE